MEVTDYSSDRDLTSNRPVPPSAPSQHAGSTTQASQMALVAPAGAQGATP